MIDFLTQNWEYLIFIVVLFVGALCIVIKQPERIKEWLVWACSQAENTLGSGTGMLKLREVYNMFIAQYPIISKFISFQVFQKWTEESLVVFKDWVNKNTKAQEVFPTIVGDNKDEEK